MSPPASAANFSGSIWPTLLSGTASASSPTIWTIPNGWGKCFAIGTSRDEVPKPVLQKEIVALRSLLRGLSEKLINGKSLDAEDLRALNAYLNVPAHVQLIQRQNGVHSVLVPDEPGWPWILSRFAASFAEMLSLGRLDRLKFCPNQGCKWLFFDQTKGNTRIWCNDRTCGNRDRVRRAREKNKKPPKRRLK